MGTLRAALAAHQRDDATGERRVGLRLGVEDGTTDDLAPRIAHCRLLPGIVPHTKLLRRVNQAVAINSGNATSDIH